MRWIVGWSLQFRYLVAALAVGLLFFGVQVLGHEKLDVFPEFAPVSVEIQTTCLGLSPEDVESLTTVPLEAALQGVPGVSDVQSYSEPQLSAIYLYFRSGTSLLHARQLVQERLQTTAPTLPTWCDPPQMYPIVSATSRVMQIGFTSTSLSPLELSTIAQWTIRPKLMGVPGVANAAIWGANPRQIMVEGDPALMRAHQVTLDELMATAADAVDTTEVRYTTGAAVGSLGFTETPAQRLDVADIQPIHLPAQVAQVPLETGNGKLITIGQVAKVTWGYPPPTGNAVVDGGHGLMMVVEKFPGANTLQVTSGIEQALAGLAPGPARHPRRFGYLPPGRVHPDRDPQPQPVGDPRLHPGRVRAAGLPVPVAGRAGQPARYPAVAGRCGDRARPGRVDDQHDGAGRVRGRGRGGRRRRDHRHGEHRPPAARLACRGQAGDPAAPGARRLARGAGGHLLRHADQHRRGDPGHAGRRPDRRVLRAARARLRAGRARLDGGRADRDARARPDPAGQRAARTARPAADAGAQARLHKGAAVGAAPAEVGVRDRRGRDRRGVVVYPRIGQDLFPDFKEPDFLVHFVTKPDTSLPDRTARSPCCSTRCSRSPAWPTSAATSARRRSARRSTG